MSARILIADGDAGDLRALSFTLRQEGHEILTAATGPDALRLLASEAPDLLVVAAALPLEDGFTLAARVRKESAGRHLPIVLVTADGSTPEKVRGLRAGADDVLVKPFHPGELLARVNGLLARYAPGIAPVPGTPHAGRITVFYGAKGGVGTTTLAVNSAIALHRELDRKVALVDGNLQFGDHHVFLDLGLDRKGIVDVVTAPAIDEQLLASVLFRHESGIELLLGPSTPEAADLIRAEHVTTILGLLRDRYDHVVVDLDRRLDDLNLAILDVADRLLVVMTADLSCLKNVRLLLETLGHLGYPEEKVELVLNRSTAITGIGVRNVESALGRSVGRQVVNDYRAAITALNRGHPFMVDGGGGIAKSLVELARGMDAGYVPGTAPKLLPSVAGG